MKEMPHPKVNPYEQNRKATRKYGYDYGCTGTYFITTCTDSRKTYFGDVVNRIMVPSRQGCVANVILHLLPKFHPNITMLDFIVMPDHIHLLFYIHNEEEDIPNTTAQIDLDASASSKNKKSTVSSFLSSIKSAITRECHYLNLEMEWQTSFFDHIVRDQNEEILIRNYIDRNPISWEIDKNRNDVWL